jgi:hypothetical protein
MPAWDRSLGYVPPTDSKRFKLDFDGDKERRWRNKLFQENERYYNGNTDKPLIVDDNDPVDDNIRLSVLKQTVDRTLSFVFPDIPTFVIDPNIEENPDEELIDETFRINGGLPFLQGLVYNGALGGHTFIKIMKPDPTLESSGEFARLINLHPSQVSIYWDAVDKDRVLWYEQRFEANGNQYITDTYFNQDSWITQQYIQPRGKTRWQVNGEQSVWESILSPIVDSQHLPDAVRKYGKPDITDDLRELNDGVNRVASDVSRILRFYAYPRTVVTGVGSASEITETAIGGLYTVANSDAKPINLEMESDLASSMNFLGLLNDNIYLTTRVVKVTGNVKDYQRVTNASIRSVYLDQLAKNQLLRWSYGELLQKVARRILLVKYQNESKAVRPTIVWKDPLPTDDTESVNISAIERNMKIVSRKTVSQKRGYSWDDEKAEMQSEEKLAFVQNKDKAGGSQLGKTTKENIPV